MNEALSPASGRDWRAPVAALLLALVTVGVYGRVCGHEFAWWDDPATIHHNPRYNPPSGDKIMETWRQPVEGLYAPVTYTYWGALAYAAEMKQADATGIHLDPRVYHTASLILHLASVLVVFAILRLLSDNVWASMGGAMLFAVHPVQVESVAWASGAKDVLCGLLSLCAVYMYLLYARGGHAELKTKDRVQECLPHRGRASVYYVAGAIVMVLAMLAKPSAMVVPVVVGALDLFVLRRGSRKVAWAVAGWAVVAAPLAVVARVVQTADRVEWVALWQRPLIAADAIVFYLTKLVWPTDMGPDYGRRPAVVFEMGHGAWLYVAWIVPVALAFWAWRNRSARPWVLAALIIFVAGVAPVLGFTPFMFQYMSTVADHYLYLSMFGPAMLLTWALVRYRRRAFAGACGVALLALAARSNSQLAIWHDDQALWTHTIKACPDSFVAPTNLAADLGREGQILGTMAGDARGRGDTARAAELAAAARRNYERAVTLLEHAVTINPQYITARHNAFVNCLRIGQHRRAAEHVEALLVANDASPPSLRCNFTTYYDAAGHLRLKAGDYDRAAAHFEKLLTLEPQHATARQSLNEARIKQAEAALDRRVDP